MEYNLVAGDTSKTIYLRLRDATTGLAKTGLVFNSAGAVCSYTLPLAARAAITLATQTVTGAWSSGGFVEVDATNCKGLYRLDLPNAAIASGAFSVVSIEFDGIIEESVLIPLEPRKANVTQWIGTACATPTVAGVPEVDLTHVAGSTTSVSALASGVATLLADWINGGRLDLLIDAIKAVTDLLPNGGALTTIGTDTARLTAARAQIIDDWVNGGRLDLLLDAIKAVTDLLPNAGALSDLATLASRLSAARALLLDEITAARLSELDAGTPGKAAAEIDLIKTDAAAILVDTGTTLDARIPAALVGGKIDANVGSKTVGLALTAQEKLDVNAEADTAITDAALATAANLATVDTVVDAIKLKTDLLPESPAKNTQFVYTLKMVDETDGYTPETGLTVTFTRAIDGGAFASATGTVAEISGGSYKVTASAADMNGAVVTHRFAATGARTLELVIKTTA